MITQQINPRSEYTQNQTASNLEYLFLGMAIVILVILFIWLFNKAQERRNRPVLIFFDVITDKLYYFGNYVGKVTFNIPIAGGNGQMVSFWAVQTHVEGSGDYYIIPSHGEFEDMVKQSDEIPFIRIMEGELIGFGSMGPEVHKIWFDRAFPKSVYDLDDIAEIPPNYILCSPAYSVGIKKEIYRQEKQRIARMFTLLHHLEMEKQAEIELVLKRFEDMNATTLQTQTSHFLSHWQSILAAWDALMKQYSTSIFTLSRLLHIRSSQISKAGISHAMSQGSIPAVAEFIRAYKGLMEDILDGLGYVGVPRDSLELTFQKANQIKQEAIAVTQENQRLQQQLQSLISQMRNSSNDQEIEI